MSVSQSGAVVLGGVPCLVLGVDIGVHLIPTPTQSFVLTSGGSVQTAPPDAPGILMDVVGSYDGCNDCSQLPKEVAWSLDHHPEQWSRPDQFNIKRGDVYVWIANLPDQTVISSDSFGDGVRFEDSDDDAALVDRAVQRWSVRKAEAALAK